MTLTIWHNGNLLEGNRPILSIHDRLRLGEGLFNTVLSIDGQLQHASKHFNKLLNNTKILLGDCALPTAEELIDEAHKLLSHNNFSQGRHALNCIITGGMSSGGIKTPPNRALNIMMRTLPITEQTEPVNAIIAQTTRRNEGSPLSNIKYANYADHIIALREAEGKGANEAILMNNTGNICCATVSTLVMVKDGAFITPSLSDGPQDGVTRSILIEKHSAQERSITPEELMSCDGIYLLNSLRGAVAVASLNGEPCKNPTLKLDKDFHLEC